MQERYRVKHLPFHVKTAFGEEFDVLFPLHEQTGDAVRIGQLLSTVLAAIDRDIAALGETANGDVLQAVAMALAVRAQIVPVPFDISRELALDLAATALNAISTVESHYPAAGNA